MRAFPKELHEARVCLTAALLRYHALPQSTKEEGLITNVLETVWKDCRAQKLTLPTTFELVLVHQVHLPSRTFATTHAALLFRLDQRYTTWRRLGVAGLSCDSILMIEPICCFGWRLP